MRILLLAACAAFAGAASHAPARAQTTASVVAVTIDATVVDASGRAVPGLAAAEFTVELDGQPRRVVAVTYFPSGPPMTGAIGPAFDAVTGGAPAYRIVVQPPDATPPGREFAVAIKVSRTAAKIQAPQRAAATAITVTGTPTAAAASSAAKSPDERLRAAIATGRAEQGLPIQIGRAVRRANDSEKLTLDVQIDIGGSAREPLTGLLALVDSRGAMRSAKTQIEQAGNARYRVDLSLPLEPGAYKLRFAVADAAGAIGAIEAPINAQLTAMGPLLASDVLRWTRTANGRTPVLLEALPPGATSIGATLELYPAAGSAPPNDLLVKMELAGIERIVTPEPRDGVLIAEAEFPLERVAGGTHTVRATVTSAGAVLGSAAATLIKR